MGVYDFRRHWSREYRDRIGSAVLDVCRIVLGRDRVMPYRVREMITGESFVNYALMKIVDKAQKDGVIRLNVPLDNEYEEPHLSELERRMKPFDEVEVFIAVYTLATAHRQELVKILNYMNKEGET